jgi:predicted DNA-binding ribbon-helix-helix protein
MTTKRTKVGRVALFRGKVRGKPLSVTLTPRHWRLLDEAAERLVLTRADLVALLIHKYAASVQLPKSLRTDDSDDEE